MEGEQEKVLINDILKPLPLFFLEKMPEMKI
nr:MAG TPA: hypothetical protein [Caudoviricetes sp.]